MNKSAKLKAAKREWRIQRTMEYMKLSRADAERVVDKLSANTSIRAKIARKAQIKLGDIEKEQA